MIYGLIAGVMYFDMSALHVSVLFSVPVCYLCSNSSGVFSVY